MRVEPCVYDGPSATDLGSTQRAGTPIARMLMHASSARHGAHGHRPLGPLVVTRPRRKGASSAVALLAGFGALTILTAITVILFAGPMPPKDLGVITAIAVAVEVTGWAIQSLWERATRRRRQYRNSG